MSEEMNSEETEVFMKGFVEWLNTEKGIFEIDLMEMVEMVPEYEKWKTKQNLPLVMLRPKTRGELLDALKQNIKCEVVASNEEITSIALDGWLKFEGKYKTHPSENVGWVIYESVK